MAGLVSFLVGHLCYIYGATAFTGWSIGAGWLPLLAVAPLTLYLFRRVSAGMRERGRAELVVPAGIYAVVLAVMLWRAAATLFGPADLPFRPLLLAQGGAFFYFADATLVWHRFVRPVPNQPLVEMCSYFAGQCFFAAALAWPPA